MKHLLLTALLAMVAFVTKAQLNEFHNATACSLRIRTICINDAATPPKCTVASTGTWVDVPPGGAITPIPAPVTCGPGQESGYEVDFHPSTGCNGNPVYFTTDGATMCMHGSPAWPPGASPQMGPCSCHNNGMDPFNVMFMHDPMAGINGFDAH